jgi:hypothetical protein
VSEVHAAAVGAAPVLRSPRLGSARLESGLQSAERAARSSVRGGHADPMRLATPSARSIRGKKTKGPKQSTTNIRSKETEDDEGDLYHGLLHTRLLPLSRVPVRHGRSARTFRGQDLRSGCPGRRSRAREFGLGGTSRVVGESAFPPGRSVGRSSGAAARAGGTSDAMAGRLLTSHVTRTPGPAPP